MSILKRALCIVLSVGMILCLTCCAKGGSDGTDSQIDGDNAPNLSHRKEYDPEAEKESFVDTDGVFEYKKADWDGPDGYVIVVPKGNIAAKKTAETLKAYYADKLDTKLSIVNDSTTETAKEILIGKTNRSQSNKTISEGEISVFVKDGKLVLLGGHDVSVNSAVEKFIRLSPEKGSAFTFDITTDFTSVMLGEYSYVWGDEFEGDGLDMTKWSFTENMKGTTSIETSTDKDVADVNDGRLKLHALHYFNPSRKGTEFKVAKTVASRDSMNWVYGYMEIRARMPFAKGCWPGFWATQVATLSGTIHDKVTVEVDIFEVFGNDDTLKANLHKHYRNVKSVGINSIEGQSEKSSYTFENSSNLSNEYHTYGMLWTPTEISMYVDGEKYVTYDITKSFDDNSDMSMFHMPLNIMFNNFVMTNETEIKTNLISDGIENLPSSFYVDYIRLYQKPNEGKIWTAIANK